MRHTLIPTVAITSLMLVGCDGGAPASEPDRAATSAAEQQAAQQRERSEQAAELERRATNLESQWTEMQTKVKTRGKTATAGLREEVAEDVQNAKAAVADLKTTTEQNWWERYERALEQSVRDVQTDVQRLTQQKAAPAPADTLEPAAASTFAERRDAFVNRLRARVDTMEEQIDETRASGARETERKDAKARIDKLQEDLDRVKNVSADDWWDASTERVSDYIGRVQDSIERLDDNTARTEPQRN
jgi:hypothetical protein